MNILLFLVVFVVDFIIEALFVQVGTKIVARFWPPFWTAVKAVFLGFMCLMVIGILALPFSKNMIGIFASFIGFFSVATIYGIMIKSPEQRPIGTGKACLVLLIQLALTVIIGLAVTTVFPPGD